MSMTLVGSGGWFSRQGAIAGEVNRVAALYGSADSITGFNSIWSQFATSDQAAVTPLPFSLAAWQQSGGSYSTDLASIGQAASISQADRDTPLVLNTFATSVQRVATQMVATAQSVQRPTLTSNIVADGDNNGDTKLFVSTTNVYGDPLDMTTNEQFVVACTSQGSGFVASFSITGEPIVPTNSWNWPQGSGATGSVTAVDPAVDATITNGGFSLWAVANTPDDWTIINGSPGTTVLQGVGDGVRTGTDAVIFTSDGSSTTKIAQEVTLSTNTVYAVTFQVKMNTNSASGSLIVQLYDPDAGAVLANDAGTNLSATYALNGGAGEVTTAYQLLTVFFSTPRQLPDTVQLRIGYNVAAVSTRELYVDLVNVFSPVPLYGTGGTQGPWVAAVANTLVSAVGDLYDMVLHNSLTTQSFVLGLERLYSLRSQGIYLPSASSPTIPDSIITH